MATYFCHQCALQMGHLPSTGLSLPIGSTYQRDKHAKHLHASTAYSLQSVFTSPSTKAWDKWIVSASLAGSVQFDAQGRKNILWAAGKHTGFEYRHGTLSRPLDAIKVVLSTDLAKVHAYPQSSTTFRTARCAGCDGPAIH